MASPIQEKATPAQALNVPAIVQRYLMDVISVHNLSVTSYPVLAGVLRFSNWQNKAYLCGKLKRDLMSLIGFKVMNFDKVLRAFVEKGLISRPEFGVYVVNEKLFGWGGLDNVKAFQLTIKHTGTGKTVIAKLDKGGKTILAQSPGEQSSASAA